MYYVLDEHNNKIEAYSKQDVLDILEKAIEDGSLANITANTSCIDKIKCCVGNETHPIGFVTQAKLNELIANQQLITNAYYFITDDTTGQDLKRKETENATNIEELLKAYNVLDVRLNELGFKESTCIVENAQIITNKLVTQGKMCICNLSAQIGQGVTATITIPNGFKPKEETNISAIFTTITNFGMTLTVKTDGTITVIGASGSNGVIQLINVGWEVA